MSNSAKNRNSWSAEVHIELQTLGENAKVRRAESAGNLKSITKRIQDKINSPVEYKTLGICADFESPDSLYGTVELMAQTGVIAWPYTCNGSFIAIEQKPWPPASAQKPWPGRDSNPRPSRDWSLNPTP